MIQRRLFSVFGVLAIAASLAYISWPVGHQPPYDANFVRLAESDLQGYCSGKTLIETGGGPDANMTARCRADKAKVRSDKPNIQIVQTAFCQGVIDAGWPGGLPTCLTIMSDNQYWPTYDGTITNQWNRARPYPRTFTAITGTSSGGSSRTGSHNGSSRDYAPIR